MAGISKRHVSLNLFDKDSSVVYQGFFDKSGRWGSAADSSSVIIPVLGGTTYTLSVSENLPVFRIYETSIAAPQYGDTFATIIRGENIKQYTFTTAADTVCIGFQGSKAVVDTWVATLMFNTGSQPLPYEPYGNTWNNTTYGIMKTATDTITTLPADLYADGNSATVGLVGNMSQTGTPTPQNPIQPSETGEKTENLVIFPYTSSSGTIDGITWEVSNDGRISATGLTERGTNFYLIRVEKNFTLKAGTYTLSFYGTKNRNLLLRDTTNSTYIARLDGTSKTATFTLAEETGVLNLYFNASSIGAEFNIDGYVMLNTGSTALPYEPYGIKIPISSANTTTPVYLGEVETTRRIKKFVLTGNENVTYDSANTRFSTQLQGMDYKGARLTTFVCSHYEIIDDGRTVAQVPNNTAYAGGSVSYPLLFVKTTDYTSDTDFKAYLAAQYSAGTPVTVWYGLTEPTTGIVNEPLRKIGDYADTVSGITIPTIAGADSFDVLTTLKPSEVTANYHGWHVGTVHERENGAWTE